MARSEIIAVIERHRADVAAGDVAASRQVNRAHLLAVRAILPRLRAVTDRIEAARAEGTAVSPAWLFQEGRYVVLLRELDEQMRLLAASTGRITSQAAVSAVELGASHATEQLLTALPPIPELGISVTFAGVNTEALRSLVGQLAPGSPLVDVLADIPVQAADRLRDAMVTGLALGLGGDEIVRSVRGGLELSRHRAELIVRTELMRSYREATSSVFRANRDVMDGWTWIADLSPRTCASCWAMHGTVHPVDEPMESHPSCRCNMAARTKSWADLGFDVPAELESSYRPKTGEQEFAARSPLEQKAILGPGGYAHYAAGDVRLADFVRTTRSAKWGITRSVKSLEQLRAEKGLTPRAPFAVSPGGAGAGSGAGSPSAGGSASPGLAPVSSALQVPSDPAYDFAREGLAIIDGVHTDGTMPATPVRSGPPPPQYGPLFGYWDPATNDLFVSATAPQQLMTFFHETGHALDNALNGGTGMASPQATEFQGWRDAVGNSRRVNDLLGVAVLSQSAAERDYARYLLRTEERWARSYAQYIAMRSSDPAARAALEAHRRRIASAGKIDPQWDDADFAPVAAAIDDLFRARGWIP